MVTSLVAAALAGMAVYGSVYTTRVSEFNNNDHVFRPFYKKILVAARTKKIVKQKAQCEEVDDYAFVERNSGLVEEISWEDVRQAEKNAEALIQQASGVRALVVFSSTERLDARLQELEACRKKLQNLLEKTSG